MFSMWSGSVYFFVVFDQIFGQKELNISWIDLGLHLVYNSFST